jgi:uncharacterized protein
MKPLNPLKPLNPNDDGATWWRLPIVWLVIAGPLVVVGASLVTAWLAIQGADPIVPQVPHAREVARGGAKERSAAPAQQGRNYVSTPTALPPRSSP